VARVILAGGRDIFSAGEIDSAGRVMFTADTYTPDGCRFTVLADERLTAFLELHAAIHRQLETRMKYWEIIAGNLSKAGWTGTGTES
jgi:hypothetical protein